MRVSSDWYFTHPEWAKPGQVPYMNMNTGIEFMQIDE